MPRILLLADAASTTGFARVSHAIGDRLVRQYGHEVHCLAVNYDGDAGKWDTAMKLYLPTKYRPQDIYGTSRYVELIAEVMPDVVMMVNDPYVILKHIFRNKFDEDLILARTRPIIAYMPVDGYNQPDAWSNIPQLVSMAPRIKGGTGPMFIPVAMSKFGQDFLGTPHMVYHGIDVDTFRPLVKGPRSLSTGDVCTTKEEIRRVLGIPEDAFLVLRVDRNSQRKNFADTWRALVPVMKRHQDVHVWFHCRAEGDQLEIPQLISREPELASRFHWPGKFDTRHGWATEDLAALYNAADLFVSTSGGEGFGLTLAEAGASGLPIIAQKISSIPEVVGPGGFLLKPERLIATESGQDQWLPDVKAFTVAIERLYGSSALRESLGSAAREHVVSSFDWDVAASQFHELITRVAQLIAEMPVPDGDDDAEPDPGPDEVGDA
jgi:glycosyltransferase involved in cell wall biosynthesis